MHNSSSLQSNVSPSQLLAKLSNLKSANETSSNKKKQLRELSNNLSFYEQYCTSTFQDLQNKLEKINHQANQMKSGLRKVQALGIQKFDKFQKMLETTLRAYDQQRKKGQKMVKQLVETIEQKLEKQTVQKSLRSTQVIQDYLRLNNRLQSILSSVSSMQKNLLSKYENLRVQLGRKFTEIQNSLRSQIEETHRESQRLLEKLQKVERDCEDQINKLNDKKQKKRYQLHQMMEKMIQDVIENDQN